VPRLQHGYCPLPFSKVEKQTERAVSTHHLQELRM
jgi:hypothetical protein